MKRKLFLFGAVFLILTSCSTDQIDADSQLLVKKKEIAGDVTTYIYNGSKIIESKSPNSLTTYTYDGDFITRIVTVEGDYTLSLEYAYEDGKLKTFTRKSNRGTNGDLQIEIKREYRYNADGTVSTQDDIYSEGVNIKSTYSELTFENGNLLKEEVFENSGISSSVVVYEYDDKKSPMSNIVGFDKLLDNELSNENNILKSTKSGRLPDDGVSTTEISSTYTYNSKGYLLSGETLKIDADDWGTHGVSSAHIFTCKYEY